MSSRASRGLISRVAPPCLLFALFFMCTIGSGDIVSPSPAQHLSSALTPARLMAVLAGIPALLLVLSGALTLALCGKGGSLQHGRLVTRGCYSFSRNPVCLGMVGIHISTAIFCGSPAGLLFTPVLVMLLTALHIRARESEMAVAFGAEWEAYRRTTPRWLPLPGGRRGG